LMRGFFFLPFNAFPVSKPVVFMKNQHAGSQISLSNTAL